MNAPQQNKSVGYQVGAGVPQDTGSFVLESLAQATKSPEPIPVIGSEAGGFDDSKYISGAVRGTDEQTHKANNQSAWAQVGARALRFVPDVALGIAEQAGYLGDLENYAGAVGAVNTDFDNWLSKSTRDAKEKLGEALPVYRKDQETFSPGDSGWWVDNIADLTESLAEFYITGGAEGKLLGYGAEKLATKVGSKLLAEKVAKGGAEAIKALSSANKLNNAAVGTAQFATSALQAYTGGVMQAQESYKNVYKDSLANGSSEEEAQAAASGAAASIVRWTTAGTSLLNITSLAPVFRPFQRELEFADKLGLEALEAGAAKTAAGTVTSESLLSELQRLKANPGELTKTGSIWKKLFAPEGVGWEAGQEAVEEFTENSAQVYGENTASDKTKKTQDYFSKEALLAAALGAVGGVLGAGVMHGIDSSNEKEAPVASRFESAVDERIGALIKYKDSKEALHQAVQNKDNLSTLIAKNELFNHNVFHAINTQTEDYLKSAYQDVLNLDPTQAEAAGYDIDETSPTYYKKTAEQAVSHLDTASKIYNSVLLDSTLPQDAKAKVISGLMAMDLSERNERNLTDSIDTFYANEKGNHPPHVLEAKKLANEVRALETVKTILETSKQTTSNVVAHNERLTEIEKQLVTARKAQEDFNDNLGEESKKDIAKLPLLSTDSVILQRSIERATHRAQYARFSSGINKLYDPKTRKARLQKEARDASEAQLATAHNAILDEYADEMQNGSGLADNKRELSVGELQDRVSRSRRLLDSYEPNSVHAPELERRINDFQAAVKEKGAAVQQKNKAEFEVAKRKASAQKGKAARQAKKVQSALRAEREAENDAYAAQDQAERLQGGSEVADVREARENLPVNQVATDSLPQVTDVHLARYNNQAGTIVNDEGELVFEGFDGYNLTLDKGISYAEQGIEILQGVKSPTVIDVTTSTDFFGLTIGDETFTLNHLKPSDALSFDEGGTLQSISLLDSTGRLVTLTDSDILYDIADPIMLYQSLLDNFLYETMLVEDNGKTYQVQYNSLDPLKSVVLSKNGAPLLETMDKYRRIDGQLTRKGVILDKLINRFKDEVLSKMNPTSTVTEEVDNTGGVDDFINASQEAVTELPNVSPSNSQLPGEAAPVVSQGPAAQASSNESQAASGVSTSAASIPSSAVDFDSLEGDVTSVMLSGRAVQLKSNGAGNYYARNSKGEATLLNNSQLEKVTKALTAPVLKTRPEQLDAIANYLEKVDARVDGINLLPPTLNIAGMDLQLELGASEKGATRMLELIGELQRLGIIGEKFTGQNYRLLVNGSDVKAVIAKDRLERGKAVEVTLKQKELEAAPVVSVVEPGAVAIQEPTDSVVEPVEPNGPEEPSELEPSTSVDGAGLLAALSSPKVVEVSSADSSEPPTIVTEPVAVEPKEGQAVDGAALLASLLSPASSAPNKPSSPQSGSKGIRISNSMPQTPKFVNGLPVLNNPEENLDLSQLSNPDFNADSVVGFELGSNNWWESNKAKLDAATQQPIFVIYNGKRVGKLEASHPDRLAVHAALVAGKAVTAQVASKESSNPLNLRNDDGTVRLRPVSVMRGEWKNGVWTDSEVKLVVATGVGADIDHDFVPETPGQKGLDLTNYESIADSVVASDNLAEGHVFALIQLANGNYVPFKLSTNYLTERAVNKVLDLLGAEDADKVAQLVYSNIEADRVLIPTYQSKFFKLTKTKSGYKLDFAARDGNIYSADLKAVAAALKSGSELAVRATKLVEGDSKYLASDIDKPLAFLDIKAELTALLSQKKFNVENSRLASKLRYTSPLTGENYANYQAYLASTQEAGDKSILQTDAWGDGMPDGSQAGVFHNNVGLSLKNISVVTEATPNVAGEKITLVPNEVDIFASNSVPVAPKKPKKKLSFDEDEVYRAVESTDTLPRDLTKAKDWLEVRGFPTEVHDYVRTIGSKVVHGSFSLNGTKLWSGSDIGTEFHEGFHGVFRTLLNTNQRQAILTEARARFGMKDETDLEVEERLAEDFRHYMLSGKLPADTATKSFFRKLLDLLKAYFGNRLSIDKLFEDIQSNDLNHLKGGDVLSGQANSAKGNFSARTQNEIVDAIASSVINTTGNANKNFADVRARFLQKVFVDEQGNEPSKSEAERLYKTYINDKSLRDVELGEDEPYDFSDTNPAQMLLVYRGWFDSYEGGKYNNLVEKGWQTLAREKMKDYGYRISGDLDLESIEESMSDEKIFGKASVESNVADTISGPVRAFLMQVPSINSTGEVNRNLLGNPIFVPFQTEVIPTLYRLLEGSRQVSEMEERIATKAKELPWLNHILNGLKNGTPKLSADVFRNQFYPAMAMVEKAFIYTKNEESAIKDEKGNKSTKTRTTIVNSNTANVNNTTRKSWDVRSHTPISEGGSGLFERQADGSYSVNKEKAQLVSRLIAELQGVTGTEDIYADSAFGQSKADAYVLLLNTLGAKVTLADVKKYLDGGDKLPGKGRKFLKDAALLRDIVVDKAQPKGQVGISAISNTLSKNGNPYESDASVTKRLSQGVSRFTISPTLSFLSGNNKSVFPINLPTALDERLGMYKDKSDFRQRVLEDIFYNPGGKDNVHNGLASWMLYNLEYNAGYDTFAKETLDVLKEEDKSGTNDTDFMELAEGKELRLRLSTFFGSGKKNMRVAFHTFSDRGNMSFLSLPRLSEDPTLNNTQFNTIDDILLSYVVQDIVRAKRAKKEVDRAFQTGKTSKLLANYHYNPKLVSHDGTRLQLKEGVKLESIYGRAMQFTQWDFLQSQDDSSAGKRLMQLGLAADSQQAFMSSLDEIKDLQKEVVADIREFLQQQENLLKDKLEELSISSTDFDLNLYGDNFERAISDFVLADTLARNEISKLFSGDEAQYKGHEDFSKRFGILESPGYKSAEQVGNKELDSKYGDFSKFNTAFINDVYTMKESFKYIEALSKYLTEDILSSYRKGSNKTDAMGFTSLAKHRAKLQGRGDWTKDHEQAYKNYYQKKGAQVDSKAGVFSLTGKKGNAVYPPLTPIKTLTDSLSFVDGRVVRIIVKHSTFPLLQELTSDMPGLDSLREHLETTKGKDGHPLFHSINMDSTAKGALFGNITLTTDADGRFNNLDQLQPVSIRTSDERSPQIVPDSSANDPLWGSQLRKMVLTSLNLGGDYTLSTGEVLTGASLFAKYNEVGSSMIDKSLEELYSKLDYSPNVWNNNEARTKFFLKLRTKLEQGADGRDLSDNYRKALKLLDVAERTDFTVPLSLPPIQRKFENMLLGMFKKEVLQQRVHGSSAVQIAELGGHMFQTAKDKAEFGELKFVTLGKDKNGKDIVAHAEVAIPFELAEKLGLEKDSLGNYNLSGVDERLLTMVGYRIPTQGKNSMLPMRIVRVLPKNVKAIMVPGFITKQMGSDFDVDKLFLMKRNYSELYKTPTGDINKVSWLSDKLTQLGYTLTTGEIKTLLHDADGVDSLSAGNPSIGNKETFAEQWKELTGELDSIIGDAKPTIGVVPYSSDVKANLTSTDYREKLQNYLIDLTEGILTSPHHAAEMMTSVDSDTLPDLAQEARLIDAKLSLAKKGNTTPTPTQLKAETQLSAQGILTELTLAQRNKSGGAGIGMYATAITGHAIGQYAKDKAGNKLQLTTEFQVSFDGHGATDLTAIIGPEKWGAKDISLTYNERLNSAVDNAKDPVMAFLNDNSFTYPVINLLLRAGTGNEIATYMCRQPIIKELTAYYTNQGMTADRVGEAAEEIAKRYDTEWKPSKQTTSVLVEGMKRMMSREITTDIPQQLNVLNNFLLYHRAGRMLAKVNKLANSDRINDMSTMSGIEEFLDIGKEVLSPTRNKYIQNASLLTGSAYPLVAKNQQIIQESLDFAANFFPYVSESMMRIKDTVRELTNKSNLQAPVLNAINQDVALYIFTRPDSPFGKFLNDVAGSTEALMNGSKSVINRLEYYKDKHRQKANAKQLSADKLLSRLRPADSNLEANSKVKTLTFESSYSMSQYEANEITDAFLNLANSKDEEDRLFAKDLVKFTLLSTGFNSSKDSLLEYIPMEYWIDKKFYAGADAVTMAEYFRNNPPSLSIDEQMDFVDKFIRNNVQLKGLVPNVYDAKGDSYPAPKTRKFYSEESNTWVRYISQYNKATKSNDLFRFVSEGEGKGLYEKTTALGVPYKLKNYSRTQDNSISEVNKAPVQLDSTYLQSLVPRGTAGVDVDAEVATTRMYSVKQAGLQYMGSPQTEALYNYLQQMPGFEDIPTSFANLGDRREAGYYDMVDGKDQIVINLEAHVTPAEIKQTMLHELVHAQTALKLYNNPKAAAELDKIRAAVVVEIKKLTVKRQTQINYGTINNDEFMAEALSNPEFQSFLRTVPYTENTSVWQKLLDIIASVLGVTPGNALHATLVQAIEVMQTPGSYLNSFQLGVLKRELGKGYNPNNKGC